MVPFFVVDRPISLEIIKGLKIPRGKKIGLMAHANTSENFRKAFREYPRRQTVKMCDSAIFNLGGAKNGYHELFTNYEEMGTDYGVMLDVFRDSRATLESAERALATYDPKRHHFQLVAVAQGKTVKQYLDCYRQLKEMGFQHIAVGGLLRKREKTARYAHVRDEGLLRVVLTRICEEFDPKWLFALGCLHPSRLELFRELDVWGDYKGWIFEYEKRDETMSGMLQNLSKNHLKHASGSFQGSLLGIEITGALSRRQREVTARRKAQKEVLAAKRSLRDFMARMLIRVRKRHHIKSARILESLKSRGLFQDSERRLIEGLLAKARIPRKERDPLFSLSANSQLKKKRLQDADRKIDAFNRQLLPLFKQLTKSRGAGRELREAAADICRVLKTSEQTHRIRQVRRYIEGNILNQI